MAEAIEFIRVHPGGWGLALVFFAAAAEYLVPPLPADSVVLASALLVVAGVHPFGVVYAAAVAGGAAGALIHFFLGRWLGGSSRAFKSRFVRRLVGPKGVEKFFGGFRKYGMWVIALNRALPGVRGVTFLAAGAAGLPVGRTMVFGLVSNLTWTSIILGLGVAVGGNWEKIDRALGVYSGVMYAVAGVAAGLYITYRWRRQRRAVRAERSS